MKMTTIGLQDLALDGLIKICGGIKNIYPFPFLTGQWFEAISKNQWKWTYLLKRASSWGICLKYLSLDIHKQTTISIIKDIISYKY